MRVDPVRFDGAAPVLYRNPMDLAGILFDKDGTLVDFDATWGGAAHHVMQQMSGGDPAVYARIAAAMHYLPETRRFRPTSPMIAGSTADYAALWAEILGRPSDPLLFAELDRRFSAAALDTMLPLGDPASVFAVLHERGFRLGIATNDAEASARAQCERLGLVPLLDFIAGYDSGHGGKPDPGMVLGFARHIGADPAEIALVGDSVHDLEAARAAGAIAIAVLSGPAQRPALEPHADHVIDAVADLPALLTRLGLTSRVGRAA